MRHSPRLRNILTAGKNIGKTSGPTGQRRNSKWRIVYVEQAREVLVIAAYYGGAVDPLYWLERLAV